MRKLDGFIGLAAALCIAFLLGLLIGANIEGRYVRKEIARRGLGAYKADQITGKVVFEWKESAK